MIAHAVPVVAYFPSVVYDLTVGVVYAAGDLGQQLPDVYPTGGGSWEGRTSALEEGRLRPRRLPGLPAWRCRPRPAGDLLCTVKAIGPERAYRASLSYATYKHEVRVVVKVRPF